MHCQTLASMLIFAVAILDAPQHVSIKGPKPDAAFLIVLSFADTALNVNTTPTCQVMQDLLVQQVIAARVHSPLIWVF